LLKAPYEQKCLSDIKYRLLEYTKEVITWRSSSLKGRTLRSYRKAQKNNHPANTAKTKMKSYTNV